MTRYPQDYQLPAETVWIPSPRGRLAAWYIPPTNGYTLICCHGTNDNREQWLPQIARLREQSGYGALLFDFAGHGESAGGYLTYGACEQLDVAAVLTYLQNRADVDSGKLGIMGYSLGAITATLAAARHPELRCLVIESGFADVQRDLSVLFRRYTGLPPFPLANLIVFWARIIAHVRLSEIRPVLVIGSISPRPVMIIADLADEIANEPFDGEHLYASAGEPKELWQVPDAAHVRAFELVEDEWVRRVGTFLNRHLRDAEPMSRHETPPAAVSTGESDA